jgi:hypothetical protein
MGQQMKQPSREQVNETRSAGAAFKAILPEDIDWKPFAAFPPSARLAILVGLGPERESDYCGRNDARGTHGAR